MCNSWAENMIFMGMGVQLLALFKGLGEKKCLLAACVCVCG